MPVQNAHLKLSLISHYLVLFLLKKQKQLFGRAIFKGAQSRLNGLKSLAKLFKFVVGNPCQSSSFLTILVPLWFIIISLMFFTLYKVLFSGFLQFNGNFVDGQSSSKYRD